jgi:protein-L-isoaspartate(D-aspartate) O-methyltransferase
MNLTSKIKDPTEAKRRRMVEKYVMERGIDDKTVIDAMLSVPRHLFVESALSERAYDDHATPIGNGQTITQPYTVALLAQEASLTGGECILEVGTGSGYTASILALLCERVYTIERINSLSNRARKIFNKLGYKNIVCLTGDGTVGASKHAPYDAIVVTAGAPEIPVPLAKQLKIGSRMVIPLDNGSGQTMTVVTRTGEDRFKVDKKGECSFVPLIGKHGWNETQRRS